jgi:hypothetical protein
VENCFVEAKNEAGLDHYQVRKYRAWYRHATLAGYAGILATSANEIRRMFTALCGPSHGEQHARPLVTMAPPQLTRLLHSPTRANRRHHIQREPGQPELHRQLAGFRLLPKRPPDHQSTPIPLRPPTTRIRREHDTPQPPRLSLAGGEIT